MSIKRLTLMLTIAITITGLANTNSEYKNLLNEFDIETNDKIEIKKISID